MNIQEKRARAENYGGVRKTADIRYLVIHFTANDGDTAKNNADYFAREVAGASAHYFVDERGGVAQRARQLRRLALRHQRHVFPSILPQPKQHRD